MYTRVSNEHAPDLEDLRCSYMMQIQQSCFDDAVKIFKDRLSDNVMDNFCKEDQL